MRAIAAAMSGTDPDDGGERGVHGFADAVHVEQGAVGETAGEADDAGLAQQLEEFADGGGFNVVEAVGKGQLKGHGGVSQWFAERVQERS